MRALIYSDEAQDEALEHMLRETTAEERGCAFCRIKPAFKDRSQRPIVATRPFSCQGLKEPEASGSQKSREGSRTFEPTGRTETTQELYRSLLPASPGQRRSTERSDPSWERGKDLAHFGLPSAQHGTQHTAGIQQTSRKWSELLQISSAASPCKAFRPHHSPL